MSGPDVKRILIIGASGAILRTTADRLRGSDLYGIDSRGSTASHGSAFSEFLARKLSRDSLDYMIQSAGGTFDTCISGVGLSSVSSAERDPELSMRLEFHALREVLPLLEAHCSRIVYLSSAAVYGESPSSGSSETDPLRPVSIYGTTKARTEEMLASSEFADPSRLTIVRPFSVFGSGMKKQFVWDAYRQLRSSGRAQFAGSADSVRDFVSVNDLADLLAVVALDPGSPQVLNACSGVASTTREVVELAASCLRESEASIRFEEEARPYDPRRLVGCANLLDSSGFKRPLPLRRSLPGVIAQWNEAPVEAPGP